MNAKSKELVAAAMLGLMSSIASPAHAQGIPVYDNANLIQQLQQVSHMVTQIENLRAQLEQAKQQYEALTGSRGMENLLRDLNYEAIPANWQETLAMMDGQGSGQISDLARSIKEQASRVDTDLLDRLQPSLREASEGFANSVASEQAVAGTAYDNAAERMARLQGLMDAIPRATDLKAVEDLQARIMAEQVLLQNETIKMQALAQVSASQRGIEQQQVREMTLKANSGTEVIPPARSWVRER